MFSSFTPFVVELRIYRKDCQIVTLYRFNSIWMDKHRTTHIWATRTPGVQLIKENTIGSFIRWILVICTTLFEDQAGRRSKARGLFNLSCFSNRSCIYGVMLKLCFIKLWSPSLRWHLELGNHILFPIVKITYSYTDRSIDRNMSRDNPIYHTIKRHCHSEFKFRP